MTYEVGKDRDNGQMKWAYYLLLHVFCFDPSGKSAIRVLVDNHMDRPDHQRSEFYIRSEPASLNKFGIALRNWNPEDKKELEWILK